MTSRQQRTLAVCAMMLVCAFYAARCSEHFASYAFMILYLYFITQLNSN